MLKLFFVLEYGMILYAKGHETLKHIIEMLSDMNVLHIILNNGIFPSDFFILRQDIKLYSSIHMYIH